MKKIISSPDKSIDRSIGHEKELGLAPACDPRPGVRSNNSIVEGTRFPVSIEFSPCRSPLSCCFNCSRSAFASCSCSCVLHALGGCGRAQEIGSTSAPFLNSYSAKASGCRVLLDTTSASGGLTTMELDRAALQQPLPPPCIFVRRMPHGRHGRR